MNRLALLTATVAGLTVLAVAPAGAATAPQGATETVTSCGNLGLQAGLATRVCADVTGNTVQIYGKVSLAGPPSPGSPAPAPKDLMTSVTSEILGSGAPVTTNGRVIFTATTIKVPGATSTVPCGSTIRGTFAVASYPWTANPVVHEVTIAC
ncbi:hypothetical protein ACM614_21645 [Streptomyces sp. 12297]|uniref:hypothetical protein n=1 Tax=Streptomyces sp. NBC_00239 TaxID=2903640 RepID=UPI002E287780|nr:hypothetical protein [Streptomyces sp. NBC_00239]